MTLVRKERKWIEIGKGNEKEEERRDLRDEKRKGEEKRERKPKEGEKIGGGKK